MASSFSATARYTGTLSSSTCLSYFYGRTGPTDGYGARQGAADSSSAERSCVGVMIFGGMASALKGVRITKITLTITCSTRGNTSTKTMTLRRSNLNSRSDSAQGSAYAGSVLGTLSNVFRGNTSTHVLDSSSNTALFEAMAAYLKEGHDILTIYNGERGSGSGNTANYLEVTSITIAVEYSKGTVHYNDGGRIVECAVYYCDGGNIVEVAPYYNDGGNIIEV